MLFLASISAVSLLIAIVFFVQGFWLILPFTGLELIILATAFYLVARGGQCCQVISVNGKTLKVAKGWTRNGRLGPEEEYEFPLAWVRIMLSASGKSWYPEKLLIGSSGRFVEVGEFLPHLERVDLAEKLKTWLVKAARL